MAPGQDGAPGRRSGLRVLVVEDDPESLQMSGALLELWGHRPILMADGPAGLEAALAERPDVVLLDLGLPGMDGFEVARRLRQALGGESMLIAAVTAFRGADYRLKAMEAGFDKYLAKPVDIDTLQKILAQAVQRAADDGDVPPT